MVLLANPTHRSSDVLHCPHLFSSPKLKLVRSQFASSLKNWKGKAASLPEVLPAYLDSDAGDFCTEEGFDLTEQCVALFAAW